MGYRDLAPDSGKEPSEFVVANGAPPHVIERYIAATYEIWCSCLSWSGPASGPDGFQARRARYGLRTHPDDGSNRVTYAKRPGRNGVPVLVAKKVD